MIDRLPLDLFGEDEPKPAQAAEVEVPTEPGPPPAATINCPWCAASVPAGAHACPACEARIQPAEPALPPRHTGTCQWCGTSIASDIDNCPACGWDAIGDNDVDLPGLTTPFSDEQIRSLYGGDDPEPDTIDSANLAASIIRVIVSND